MRIGIYLGRHSGSGGGIGIYARAFVEALGRILEQTEFAQYQLVLYGDRTILTSEVLESINSRNFSTQVAQGRFHSADHYFDNSLDNNSRVRIVVRLLKVPPSILGGHRVAIIGDQLNLPPLFRSDKIEAVHCLANYGIIYSLVPQIVTVHDLFQAYPPEIKNDRGEVKALRGAVNRLFFRGIFHRQFKRIKSVIVDTASVREEIYQRFGFDLSQQTVVPLGLDQVFIDFWNERRANQEQHHRVSKWLEQRNLPLDYVLLLASSDPRKNLVRTIRAWVALPEEYRKQGLVIRYLDPEARATVNQIVPAAVKQQCVHESPWIERKEFPLLLRGARVVLMPTLAEGFGLPSLEALSVGAAVVSAELEVLSKAANSTANCYFCDPYQEQSIATALKAALEKHPRFAERTPATIALEGAVRPGTNGTPRPRSIQEAAQESFSIYKNMLNAG